jgi:hypothetical protein
MLVEHILPIPLHNNSTMEDRRQGAGFLLPSSQAGLAGLFHHNSTEPHNDSAAAQPSSEQGFLKLKATETYG